MASKRCSVPGCELAHLARGLCTKHWREWRATADDADLGYKYLSLQEAFDAWPTHAEGECIIWDGNRTGYEPNQYGKFTYRNEPVRAHCAAYELAYGPVAYGMDVDHICHNKLCVNPKHLRETTRKQNQENRNGANSNSLTGERGITYDKSRDQYRVRLKHNYQEIHVGRFDTLEEARAARAIAAQEIFTHTQESVA